MFFRVIHLSLALFLFAGFLSAATESSGTLSPAAMESYYTSLRTELDKQNERVEALLQRAQRGQQVPTQIQRVEIEQAIVMLDVKKTLYANFFETETILRSPAVRNLLHQILSQTDISVADLSALQNLVRQEKVRLGIN